MAYIKSQQERINKGLCKECGTARGEDGTSIRCRNCAKGAAARSTVRSRKLRAKWKEDDRVCSTCGAECEDKKLKTCLKCRDYAIKARLRNLDRSRKRKRELNQCRCCSSQAMEKRCKSCWTKDILRKHNIDPNLWELFWKKLEDQNFACFYTGIKITPEINASLDHIMPKAKGGTNDFNNLVWCDRKINSFKNDNDYESLINICDLILFEHQNRKISS